MPPDRSDLPFRAAYLWTMADFLPVSLCGGLFFALATVPFSPVPGRAFVGGLAWGLFMWLSVGSIAAVGFAWRRSAVLPVGNRQVFPSAVERVCEKFRLVALSGSSDQVVLVPRRVRLVLFMSRRERVRCQKVCIDLLGGTARLTAPALTFWDLKREFRRALSEGAAGGFRSPGG
jgi:hypothetical protein